MRFGINLRGDLAKLDDAEIASRFEELLSELEAKRKLPMQAPNKFVYRLQKWSFRGLFHARFFYKIQALIFAVFAAFDGQIWLTRSAVELYLVDCEFADVRDEIERRV